MKETQYPIKMLNIDGPYYFKLIKNCRLCETKNISEARF